MTDDRDVLPDGGRAERDFNAVEQSPPDAVPLVETLRAPVDASRRLLRPPAVENDRRCHSPFAGSVGGQPRGKCPKMLRYASTVDGGGPRRACRTAAQ